MTLRLDQLDGADVFRPAPRRAATDPDTELRRSAERAATQAAERGWKTGHAAGWEAGYQVGVHAATKDVARMVAALSAAADDLRRRAAIDLNEAEDAIVAAAIELASVIIGREVAVASDPGADAIARALALLPPEGGFTVRLAPADAERLGAGVLPAGREVTLLSDAGIEPGGCVIEAGPTSIDAQLGAAIERATAFLLHGDVA